MTVAFFSSVLNHHQIEFCDKMFDILGEDFIFVSSMEMEEQRIKLKYSQFERDYELKAYLSEQNKKKADDLFQNADVVLCGGDDKQALCKRLTNEKITFLYRERLFKHKLTPILYLKYLRRFVKEFWRFRNKPFYLLCASAYSYSDHKHLGMFVNKAFYWGYFPKVKKYDDIEEIIKLKRSVSILWVARFIKWKHPEMPIKIAAKLRSNGYKFKLNMIGDGVCRPETEKLIKKYCLEDGVYLLGSMPPEEVRKNMEKSEIFLFTSDRKEGWGAVLNESMNSGCAVVANKAIGSVPYLIKDGENGVIYNGRTSDLYKKVKYLLENPEKRKEMGRRAYITMTDVWNADYATERFVQVIKAMVENRPIPLFADGPMRIYNENIKY